MWMHLQNRTTRFRVRLGQFSIRVALVLIGSLYLAGVLLRIEVAIQR